jgi:DNA adenine methylase
VRYLSPLRYPGGKARLAPYIANLIASQEPRPRYYAEPFAGGAGAALRLLIDEEVDKIYINDLDPGIGAFWRCVFEHSDEFVQRIETQVITISAWHAAHATYANPRHQNDLDLGFATFFLNRCNRSGILTARPIGGLHQTGSWKIDARFNRRTLSDRVRLLAQYRERVILSEQDGLEFLRSLESLGNNVLVYVDPPYLVQGSELYLDSLSPEDHSQLASFLRSSTLPWFLTYDTDERITEELYDGLRTLRFDIAHTAHAQHIGAEYAVFGDSLTIPLREALLGRNAGRWIARYPDEQNVHAGSSDPDHSPTSFYTDRRQ